MGHKISWTLPPKHAKVKGDSSVFSESNLRSLMNTLHLSLEDARNALDIPREERTPYEERLKNK